MRFSDIVDHLGNRGFATRAQWGSNCYLVFGIDNIAWMVFSSDDGYGNSELRKHMWVPCLAEVNADDWEILDMYWETPRDDYLPFV